MKHTISAIIVLGLLSAFTEVSAQKNRTLSNGFSIVAEFGFPSSDFGTIEPVADDYKYGIQYGLQIGNRWYFSPKETYGFGLMVNWLDVTYANKKTNTQLGEFRRVTLDYSFLEVGPVGTFALDEEMAIDGYYNLRPTVIATAYRPEVGDDEGYGGFGVTHAFGANFRYKVLLIGLEYVLGTVKVSQDSTDPDLFLDSKINANAFRILVGAKF